MYNGYTSITVGVWMSILIAGLAMGCPSSMPYTYESRGLAKTKLGIDIVNLALALLNDKLTATVNHCIAYRIVSTVLKILETAV